MWCEHMFERLFRRFTILINWLIGKIETNNNNFFNNIMCAIKLLSVLITITSKGNWLKKYSSNTCNYPHQWMREANLIFFFVKFDPNTLQKGELNMSNTVALTALSFFTINIYLPTSLAIIRCQIQLHFLLFA